MIIYDLSNAGYMIVLMRVFSSRVPDIATSWEFFDKYTTFVKNTEPIPRTKKANEDQGHLFYPPVELFKNLHSNAVGFGHALHYRWPELNTHILTCTYVATELERFNNERLRKR